MSSPIDVEELKKMSPHGIFECALSALVDRAKDKNTEHTLLVVLAEVLQRELACDVQNKKHAHSSTLELIMRAVKMILEEGATQHNRRYIKEKLSIGLAQLDFQLTEMPKR